MFDKIGKFVPVKILNLFKKNLFLVSLIQKIYSSINRFPKAAVLHINSECNLDCSYCYSKKNTNVKMNWYKIIKQLIKYNFREISFTGGEPLLDKNIKRYIRLCQKNHVSVRIFTNALLIDDDWLDYFSELRFPITLIIKFDDKQCYEKYSLSHSYDKLLDIMKMLRDRGLSVVALITVTKQNFDKLDSIIETCRSLDVGFSLERYIPINKPIDKELELTASEMKKAMTVLEKHQNQNSHFQLCSILTGNHCICYSTVLSIDVDGDVKPCVFASDEQIIGNVRTSSIREICHRFSNEKQTWLKIPKECQKCGQKYLCHGGCKTYTFLKYGKYGLKDPLCSGKNQALF